MTPDGRGRKFGAPDAGVTATPAASPWPLIAVNHSRFSCIRSVATLYIDGPIDAGDGPEGDWFAPDIALSSLTNRRDPSGRPAEAARRSRLTASDWPDGS